MESAMPHPLPNATGHKFRAGEMARDSIQYPHLPKSIPEKAPHVRYPSLSKTGHKAPATKLPMGYTCPIMTKHGGHPLDTGSMLPPIGGR